MKLENLKTTEQCSVLFPAIFPTKHAVEHLIRQNRAALIARGVLHVVNTRKFLDVTLLGGFVEELSCQKLDRHYSPEGLSSQQEVRV